MSAHLPWWLLLVLVGCAHRGGNQVVTISADEASELSRLEARVSPEMELDLVMALERARLFNLAFIYASALAKSSSPQRATALETLVRLQEQRQDDFLIPSLLERFSTEKRLDELSSAAAARVMWLRARIAYRRGLFGQVVSLCEQVPSTSADFARAQYLMALALADEPLDAGGGHDRARSVLSRLAEGVDARQERAEAVHAQSLLALGRLAYARREWSVSVAWYERAAKRPSVRATALFEQSLALLRAGDFSRALAVLRSDEVRQSGNPEVAVTEAMASHFSRDAPSAEAALARTRAAPRVDWAKAEPGRPRGLSNRPRCLTDGAEAGSREPAAREVVDEPRVRRERAPRRLAGRVLAARLDGRSLRQSAAAEHRHASPGRRQGLSRRVQESAGRSGHERGAGGTGGYRGGPGAARSRHGHRAD